MKVLMWIVAALSVIVSLFFSFVGHFASGLGLSGTAFGEIVNIMAMFAPVVCVVGIVLGINRMRKGKKKAFAFVLMGLGYCVVMVVGMLVDDAVHTKLVEKDIAERNVQQYGENWDSAPAIDGIPELYQEVLNQFYAVVKDGWTAGQLMDLGAVSMSEYYGDVPLDNIGFALVDLNGDKVDELVIGAVAKADQQGNEIFCICTDPENPFYAFCSVEGEVYYLHAGEADDTYETEIAGTDRAWVIQTAAQENTFDFSLREGVTMDPAGRMTLAMTPFSQYK